MHVIVLVNVNSYWYAGMAYANPHAVTSGGGTTYTYDNKRAPLSYISEGRPESVLM